MIAIVDYDTGNIRSVTNALARVGCTDWVYTDDKQLLASADKVILPGVGEASTAMAKLADRGLDTFIPTLTQPVLGICVGTQLMCQSSEEGDVECMGIFRTRVRRFNNAPSSLTPQLSALKVPHMGWNTLTDTRSDLFKGFDKDEFVYFVHSFYVPLNEFTAATTDYILPYSSALHKDNFYATQFHPDKSGKVGERILRNFIEL